MINIGFILYILFTVSWFLHLPARIEFLGIIRIDYILICMTLSVILIFKEQKDEKKRNLDETTKILIILIFYILISIPFAEWPGSALHNLQDYVKVIIFYFFTVSLLTTEKRLKTYILIFLIVQTIRVYEPLFLNITENYWGSFATINSEEYMNRLSGAPHDIINPNGLAFVIVSILPFYYYLSKMNAVMKMISIVSIPVLIYTLTLTGSRSGIIALFIIITAILIKSKNKLYSAAIIIITMIVFIPILSADLRDRYSSIIGTDSQHSVTAQGRLDGIESDLRVFTNRPIFGHGIGTSMEANANYTGHAMISHNLYTEILVELGIIGLFIFILYIKSIIVNLWHVSKRSIENTRDKVFMSNIKSSMQVWLIMNIIFSIASYGLLSYEWYLFGGLSVAIGKIASTT